MKVRITLFNWNSRFNQVVSEAKKFNLIMNPVNDTVGFKQFEIHGANKDIKLFLEFYCLKADEEEMV